MSLISRLFDGAKWSKLKDYLFECGSFELICSRFSYFWTICDGSLAIDVNDAASIELQYSVDR